MEIIYKNKKIEIHVRKVSELGKITGLMFRKKTTNSLLFMFNRNSNMRIHSFFVFFNFLAIWADSNDRVIEWKVIKPFTLSVKPKKSFMKLIEIPMSKKNQKILEFFVGKGKI